MDAPILDRDGRPGAVEGLDDETVRVRLPDGSALSLARALVTRSDDGRYRADVVFADLGTHVLREVEERLSVRTEVHETARVVARTITDTTEVPVDAAGWRETVDVERVPIGRVVEAAEPPREEGDVTIIPVYEEVLVVHKQLVLREEVRLTRRREPVPGPPSVAVRRQRVEVERLPPRDAAAARPEGG